MQSRVTISERGVITIPAELLIEATAEGILLRPTVSVPIELYSEERISEFAEDEGTIGKHLPDSA